jgi:hypothetical protein
MEDKGSESSKERWGGRYMRTDIEQTVDKHLLGINPKLLQEKFQQELKKSKKR